MLEKGELFKMNKCPNCGEETISDYKKFMLGPGRTIDCPNCNAKISVSWWTMVMLLVVLIVIFTLDDLVSMGVYAAVSMATIGLYLVVHKLFVPLVVKKD